MSNMRAGMSNHGRNSVVGYVEVDPSGRYGRLGEVLGKGAMKTVYRAFDEVLGMEVAWSQILLNDVLRSPEELQRLYTEVHLLRNLRHESLLTFYTSWIDGDKRTFNFITEMFSSGSLRQYRQKYKQVGIRAIKNWSRQILCGLVYLHSQNPPVIHRDLKCDNIFVNGHLGQVMIGDLGLAAILRDSTYARSVIGTPEFMAPELYEEEYTELVDVYAFGMCVLEMLTSEYPYSECSNPAQIYKKVSAGKKPAAFYRIEDAEAQRFVGICLDTAANRLPAHQLLLDPFLSTEVELLPDLGPPMHLYSEKQESTHAPLVVDHQLHSTDMTITGKINPVDKTIFLKVQITDKDGEIRNVHFPFNILYDTPVDVAMEMVRELDLSDWEPFEIAEMIAAEISSLVPEWKDEDKNPTTIGFPQQHTFCYDDDNDDKLRTPYYELSSPSGSHQSVPWSFRGDLLKTDDTSSQSSYSSAYNFSDASYCPRDDNAGNSRPGTPTDAKGRCSTMLSPKENSKPDRNSDALPDLIKQRQESNPRKKLTNKIRTFMDVRSQLLHRALVQALHKRRSCKTVGSVENIGFQDASEFSGKTSDLCRSSARNSTG